MKIKPKLAFRHFSGGPSLDTSKVYEAILATNQPNWKEEGKIFVRFSATDESNSILLVREDYDIVEE
mgnify:CR=1 FL=1